MKEGKKKKSASINYYSTTNINDKVSCMFKCGKPETKEFIWIEMPLIKILAFMQIFALNYIIELNMFVKILMEFMQAFKNKAFERYLKPQREN